MRDWHRRQQLRATRRSPAAAQYPNIPPSAVLPAGRLAGLLPSAHDKGRWSHGQSQSGRGCAARRPTAYHGGTAASLVTASESERHRAHRRSQTRARDGKREARVGAASSSTAATRAPASTGHRRRRGLISAQSIPPRWTRLLEAPPPPAPPAPPRRGLASNGPGARLAGAPHSWAACSPSRAPADPKPPLPAPAPAPTAHRRLCHAYPPSLLSSSPPRNPPASCSPTAPPDARVQPVWSRAGPLPTTSPYRRAKQFSLKQQPRVVNLDHRPPPHVIGPPADRLKASPCELSPATLAASKRVCSSSPRPLFTATA